MAYPSLRRALLVPLILSGAILATAACSDPPASGEVLIESEEDKALYSLGQFLGRQLGELELDSRELDRVMAGIRDQVEGVEPRVAPEEQQERAQRFARDRERAAADRIRGSERAYVDSFIEDGGKITDSGLAYRIIAEGEGDNPGANDVVEVHYEGRLTSGEVFDSSHARGETATFPLNRVIPGWTEGLQLIAPGGKIELVIPSELGYGDRGAPPNIPGGATLIFEVELIDVK